MTRVTEVAFCFVLLLILLLGSAFSESSPPNTKEAVSATVCCLTRPKKLSRLVYLACTTDCEAALISVVAAFSGAVDYWSRPLLLRIGAAALN